MATHINTISVKVCSSCVSAMREELRESSYPVKAAKQLAIRMGGDIPDHECTLAQNGKKCGCGCNR